MIDYEKVLHGLDPKETLIVVYVTYSRKCYSPKRLGYGNGKYYGGWIEVFNEMKKYKKTLFVDTNGLDVSFDCHRHLSKWIISNLYSESKREAIILSALKRF